MDTELIIQGRHLGLEDLGLIRHWLATEPDWNRTRLSRELCERWGWRNGAGRLKDMACRTLLLKLERRGAIQLPVRQRPSPNASRNRRILDVPCERVPITGTLGELQPVRIENLGEGHSHGPLFRSLLQQHHYLGLRNSVGENIKYLAHDRRGRPLACLLFGAAAWKAHARDAWIGWTGAQRQHALCRLANNTRFLVLPWVRVPHLASHLLGCVARRLDADWRGKYGHGIELLETFVDRERFRGTCYRAAGWLHVGATTGRSRNDREQTLSVPVKDIYLRPLREHCRRRLCA
ncbi:MAG: Druantia anti-phage system protein DruA [Roseovarius sp.]